MTALEDLSLKNINNNSLGVIPAQAGIQRVLKPTKNHMSQKTYYIYILASKRNGTLYIGVTNDLERRIVEHKTKMFEGFTEKYDVNMLVYFEDFGDVDLAIVREKQIKKWNRKWKLRLIEKFNPEWKDLSRNWFDWNFKIKN
jgi:putative endonuclease